MSPERRFGPDTVLATYRVKAGKEGEFLRLLERHGPLLARLGLTDREPSLVFRGTDASGGPVLVEIFTWTDAHAPRTAHEHPEVSALWGAMEALVEERAGRPKWEFPHVAPVDLVASRR